MQVIANQSLQAYNSFGIDASAKYFAAFASCPQLQELLGDFGQEQRLVLGGGSNLLFTGDFNGIVLKNELRGMELVAEDEQHYYVTVQAGENWHEFVQYCLQRNYAGLENLSLIPGNAGASPMQNIGAYGVEIKDVFHSLDAWHIGDRSLQTFSLNDCAFGYRESVFKKKYKDQFVILNVTFRLNKVPVFNTGYGVIEQELERIGVTSLSIQAIAEAVIRIRSSKLPDPKKIGNAGSFFKNPIIPTEQYQRLLGSYADMPGFAAAPSQTKVPAGWLIEKAGWKGYREGDAGCYEKQALVLVNYGHASGSDIYALSEKIIQSVRERFSIPLEREVNMI
ncbi:UDP-N-acetylmuramate dehydrogenase [Sediminibacterium soli]|uniref:UDP-N-acetylmuramate dehydrogenase n=1 Tax=Sediminibacterium soli TaxID=2698829 RepID=UPI00137A9581|nr:UDP-N-acetylmuramate dehydrogenase [Sediminibacterium soli]NCI45940.1 UDP-N-acetylmuramate dehydrogenase [Sediminibacterium soli]